MTAASDKWTTGAVAIFYSEDKMVVRHPGTILGNIGLYHEKAHGWDDRAGWRIRSWQIYHQPSGLRMFIARTRNMAQAIVQKMIDRDGVKFLDRYAAGEPTDADWQAYNRLKTSIEAHGKDASR